MAGLLAAVSVAAETSPPVPGNFRAALGLAGGFAAFVAWDQAHWWRVKEDYAFGWLVPVLTLFVVQERWAEVRARLRAAAAGPVAPRWVRWCWQLAAGAALAVGAAFFLLGAFHRAGAGTSQPGTLALTAGMVALVLPLLFFHVPAAAPGGAQVVAGGWRALGADPRARVAALFVFPVAVWLISAPLVSAVESQLSLFLLRRVVTVVAGTFDLLGFPLEQQGNVLLLPKGPVGVEDACSGIRSLTACLFAGTFLGAAFFDRTWQKVVLVTAAMGFAFVMNLGRSLFLTGWAYAHGPEAISGPVHEVAGYAVLGLTCAGLFVLVPVLRWRPGAWVEREETGATAGE